MILKTLRLNFFILLVATTFYGNVFAAVQFDNVQPDSVDYNPKDIEDQSDPLEPLNRFLFEIHKVLDGLFLQPIAEIYEVTVHSYVQDRVHNTLQNLNIPTTFVNDCLQGEGERAGNSLVRFLINSTMGIGGMYDVAYEAMEIPAHHSDFGQTLAHYGVDSGPYLFIPLLGPSNFRDFLGTIFDYSVDPVNYALRRYDHKKLVYIRTGVDAVDQRSKLLPVTNRLNQSYDPYVAYKAESTQYREFNLKNGDVDTNDFDTPAPDESE